MPDIQNMVEQAFADKAVVLEVTDLKKHFPVTAGILNRQVGNVYAVDGISFAIRSGETLGLVGESGSGKSTAGKTVLRLLEPTGGIIRLQGRDITTLSGENLRRVRRDMQMVFQDPYASLNPRMTAGEIVAEPMRNYGEDAAHTDQRVRYLFDRVGLRSDATERYPHEFSGGQRQRLGVARALALRPSLIVADEPVSALDVSVQAQVLNLLIDLQEEFDLALLFISHDLAVVEHISHRVAVMYLGQIVELADRLTLYANPQHPYTEALLSAAPLADPSGKRSRQILKGDIPSPIKPPSGCRFHTRCPLVFDRCRSEMPAVVEVAPHHWAACHLRPVFSSATSRANVGTAANATSASPAVSS